MPKRIKENSIAPASYQSPLNADSPLKQKRTRSEVLAQEDLPFVRRTSPRKCVNGSMNTQLNSPKSPTPRSGHSAKKCDDASKSEDIQLKSDFNSHQANGEISRSNKRQAPSDFSVQASSPGTRKSPRRCTSGGQNGDNSMNCGNGPAQLPKSPCRRLSDQFSQMPMWNPKDSAQMHALKEALHVSVAPSSIVCREEEQKKVFEFCQHSIEKEVGGSLYVCGCPGTGKTLSIDKVKDKLVTWAKNGGFKVPEVMSINCTSLVSTSEIFDKIVERYHPRKRISCACSPLKYLQDLFSHNEQPSSGMMLMIVDEMDYLITKAGAVLHDLFMLTTFPFSKFILLGIANAIDLADRFLPKLQSLNCKPILVTFRAYSKEQILKILQQRLLVLSLDAFHPQALELCARRVAAASGDMRKALSVCRTAVELLEAELQNPVSFNLSSDSSTMDQLGPAVEKLLQPDMNIVKKLQVGVEHMAIALSKTFKSTIVDTIQILPQHQQIILCSLVKLFVKGKKATTVGELNKSYVDICKSVQVPPVNMLEFSNMCKVLADQGILKLGSSREERLKRVNLKIDDADITFALQGIRFFRNCLQLSIQSHFGRALVISHTHLSMECIEQDLVASVAFSVEDDR
ncbi:hypothetical protein H6P81_006855 [Aristolochia fimbriata]|uniref:Cell division control protein n=1 Tax=Aristolochia fimbriata TaxID=158543 RepID=A0AAV7EZQ5_ARIFI|nr:hypothetical protein H6P81_006855 [Aristolochia fimbriata]